VRTLSKMVKKTAAFIAISIHASWLAPSSSPSQAVWSPIRLSSLRAASPCESGVNHFIQHAKGLSKFPHPLLPVSTSVALPAMEAFVLRCLWSAPTASFYAFAFWSLPIFAFLFKALSW
jgi:hypothetical protein